MHPVPHQASSHRQRYASNIGCMSVIQIPHEFQWRKIALLNTGDKSRLCCLLQTHHDFFFSSGALPIVVFGFTKNDLS